VLGNWERIKGDEDGEDLIFYRGGPFRGRMSHSLYTEKRKPGEGQRDLRKGGRIFAEHKKKRGKTKLKKGEAVCRIRRGGEEFQAEREKVPQSAKTSNT